MWEYRGKRLELDLEDYDTAVRYQQALEAMAARERQMKETLASDGDSALRGPEGIRAYVEMFRSFFAALFGQQAMEELFEGRYNIRECDEAYLSLLEYIRGQLQAARQRKERFAAYLPQSRQRSADGKESM